MTGFVINFVLNPEWEPDEDSITALTEMGYALEHGTIFEKDYEAASKLYAIAAEAGDSTGLNNLAWMYQNGYGVERDLSKAIEIYVEAAENGSARSMVNLGNIYEFGTENGKPDYQRMTETVSTSIDAGIRYAKRIGAITTAAGGAFVLNGNGN